MATTSKRLLIARDLVNRLSFIQKAKGYSSDAGLNIYRGELVKLGPDDPASALCVFFGDDAPHEGGAFTHGATVRATVPILIHAVARIVRPAHPLEVYEGLISDIKEAVEIEGRDPGTNAARDRYLGAIEGSPTRPASLPTSFERQGTQWHYREGGLEIAGVTVGYSIGVEEGWGQP